MNVVAMKNDEDGADGKPRTVNGVAGDHLLKLIRKIESLETQKTEIAEEIKGVYGEAKAHGFDAKILRKVVSIRKREPEEVSEEQMLLDVYMQAIGMVDDHLTSCHRYRAGGR